MTTLLRVAFLFAVCAGCVFAVGGGDASEDEYMLRAVFDSGSGLRTDMDVRVAGIEVGRVRSVSLDQTDPVVPRAVAIIAISDRRAMDFRADATCAIKSATLLGDRYVDCVLTRPRKEAEDAPPPLAVREGKRQLPVTQTSSPVDPDLFFDIFRLPVRQRLSIVINELGTGLAGSGEALRSAVRRADPAFFQLERTLDILAGQRRALARLADGSDRVLEPLARERDHLAGFVTHGEEVLGAVADRRAALAETFERLPGFLRELRPTLAALRGLTGEAGPALADLDAAATQLSDATVALEPSAREGTRGLRALGSAADAQLRGLTDARPLFDSLAELNPAARPVWTDLRDLLASLRSTGGFERLVELPMAVGLTSNGFDKFGYYSRAQVLVTTCTSYAVRRTSSCIGQFGTTENPQKPVPARANEQLMDYMLGGDS